MRAFDNINQQTNNNNQTQYNNFVNNNNNNNNNMNNNNMNNNNMNNNMNNNNMNNNNMNNNNMNNNMNNMNMGNMGNFMPQMSPQQYQMWMNMQLQQFEMQKQQARQIGQLLKRQKELMEEMKRKEEARKNEDRDIILFFNHNYDILPLTFKQSTFVSEALMKYLEQTSKQNVKFKFEDIELKIDSSAKTLKDIKGLVNGAEIIVEG